ncbi:hypothetical protein Tcan_11840, partial [Toxocara canis]
LALGALGYSSPSVVLLSVVRRAVSSLEPIRAQSDGFFRSEHQMDKITDPVTLVIASTALSCTMMIVVIIVNGILLCALEHGEVTIEIARCEEKFVCAIKAAKFAALPMIAVVALSEISGLAMEQVVGEYDKDSMERRAIIYSVIGRDGFTKDFIKTCPRFLQDGYRDEALLLKDKL